MCIESKYNYVFVGAGKGFFDFIKEPLTCPFN